MSKVVDERVVEMRFDNRDFESNVKTSMSTLDRLKKALKLDGLSKGLDNLGKSAKKVDMSGLSNGIDTVNARFSAMQVVGMTALSNITSAAMRAGTNMAKAFTIDPITSGFREYETQLNSIQTILANTKSKGTTIEDVTAALDELNKYADQTIYNFTEMTKNIGTFTAAGVDLDTSVGAIKGIANLGAMSSSTSAQVSTAMYQLSQALATGRVSLMDWRSVVNAGMGGEQFRNALKRTAEHFGTDVDGMIKKYGSFQESLTQGGWLTAEVLTETLNQIGGAYDETALKAQGWSDAQIAEILDLADTASKAATDVTSFSKLVDTLKESVGSSWATFWSNIFGDINQAKTFFTGMKDLIEPFVTGPVNALNSVLEQTMNMGGGSRWGEFTAELDKAGVSVDAFQKKLSEVASGQGVDLSKLIDEYGSLEEAIASGDITADMITDTLKQLSVSTDDAAKSTKSLAEWQKVVDDVWFGTYGNVDTGRIEKLTKAGWEFADVQKLVNMTVDGHRLTLEDLSAAQIVSMGYTQEQADALVELAKEAEAAGTPLNTLVNDILNPKKSGRELLLGGFENILKAILNPLKAVGDAFGEVFAVDPKGLYNALETFHRFTEALVQDKDTLDNITSTFKGLFGVIKIFTSLLGGGFGLAFKGLTLFLEKFDLNILDVTAAIGEAVYAFSEWLTSGQIFSDVLDGIVSLLGGSGGVISDFFNAFTNFGPIETATTLASNFFGSVRDYVTELIEMEPGDAIKKILNDVTNAFKNAKDKIKNITWDDVLNALTKFGEKARETFNKLVEDMKTIGPDIIDGLQNGLKDGVDKIFKFIEEIANKIIEAAKAVLGIHSPSTVFFEIGKNIIDGLCNGISYFSSKVTGTLSGVIEDIKGLMAGIDWGTVIPVMAGIGAFAVLYQLTDALQTFATGLKGFSAPFQSAANVMNTVNDFLKQATGTNTSSKGFQNFANGVKAIATAIGILAASVAVLSQIEVGDLVKAVGVIIVLAGVLGGLAAALNKFGQGVGKLESLKLDAILLSLGTSFALLAVSAKILSTIDDKGFSSAAKMITIFGVIVAALTGIAAIGGPRIELASKTISKIGVAFLALSIAAKILGSLSPSEFRNAARAITYFALIITELTIVAGLANLLSKGDASASIGKMAASILILGIAAKVLGSISASELNNAANVMSYFAIIISELAIVAGLANRLSKFGNDVGHTVLSMAGSMILMAASVKILGGMSESEINKGIGALTALVGMISVMTLVAGILPPGESAKVSASLLAMTVSVGILAAIAVLLGMVDEEQMKKGLAAVGLLSAMVSVMAYATKGAGDIQGPMIGLAVAIGVLAASLYVLANVDATKLYTAAGALSVVIGMFALLTKSTTGLKGGKGGSMASIIGMVLMITAIGGVLYALASLPIESSRSAAVSLSAVLLALAGACRLMSGLGGISPAAYGSMVAMMGVMTVLIGILSLLSLANPQASLGQVAALTTLLLSMTAACYVMGNVKSITPLALGAMAELTAIMLALVGVLAVLSEANPQVSFGQVAALSALLIAMSAACVIMGYVKTVSPTAIAAMGALIVIVSLLSSVLTQISGLDPTSSLGNVIALGTLLGIMVGVTAALSAIGPLATGAMPGVIAFLEVVGILSLAFAAVGALVNGLNIGDEALAGIETAGKILGAVGEALGSLVGGALEGVSNSLPAIGENIAGFFEAIKPMFDAITNLDPSAGQALADIGAGLLAITAGGVIDQLTQFFGGESNFDVLAENLPKLGSALSAFGESLSPESAANAAIGATALKTVAEAMSQVPNSGGLLGDLLGGKDYTGFANGMASIGTALASFDTVTQGITAETLQPKAEALGTIVKALSEIPNSGGLLGDLLGGKDYTGFANGMASIGTALASFDTVTQGITVEDLQPRIDALKTLITAMSGIEDTGGFLQTLLGGPDYSGFADSMKDIGKALSSFYTSCTEISDVGVLNTGTEALRNVITVLSELPTDTGWLGGLLGGNTDYSGFSDGLTSIGTALKSYAESIPTDMSGVTASTTEIKRLITFLKSISESGDAVDQGITVVKKMKDVGKAFKEYATNIAGSGFTDVSNSINSVKQLITLIESMVGMDTSGIATFKAAVDELATVNLQGVIEAFQGATSQMFTAGANLMTMLANGIQQGQGSVTSSVQTVITSVAQTVTTAAPAFSTGGMTMMQNFAKGIQSGGPVVVSSIASVLVSAAASIRGYYSSFYGAGAYISQGLANGMRSKLAAVRSAANQIANEAARATRAASQIKSPSRVFMKIGGYMGEGLVIGLDTYQSKVYDSGYAVGGTAIDGLSKAISGIDTMIDPNMDINPTITPVIDLTNVKNGVDSIDNMFNKTISIDVLGRVGSIDRLVNSRNQNGGFDDVVYAVDRLRRGISELSRPTYNVGGITYDDGSNVASAVEQLVRATRLERRI